MARPLLPACPSAAAACAYRLGAYVSSARGGGIIVQSIAVCARRPNTSLLSMAQRGMAWPKCVEVAVGGSAFSLYSIVVGVVSSFRRQIKSRRAAAACCFSHKHCALYWRKICDRGNGGRPASDGAKKKAMIMAASGIKAQAYTLARHRT